MRNKIEFLYKYTSIEAARAILSNQSLRWSRPDTFNDPFEFRFFDMPDFDSDELLAKVERRFVEVLDNDLPVSNISPIGKMILSVRSSNSFSQRKKDFISIHIRSLRDEIKDFRAKNSISDQAQKQLRDAKVLCLSDDPTNLLMWSHYGTGHAGVVLKFLNRPWDDSVFGVAKPVNYSKECPCLYNMNNVVDMLVGRFDLNSETILDSVIFTKSEMWRYEREWRIIMHITNQDESYEDVGFSGFDLAGLVFGIRTMRTDVTDLATLALKLNPGVTLTKAKMLEKEYSIGFESV